ncbi:MAG: DUF748 domain-containing protein [Alphaproteobacteria bacterium]|nr:DUF748 domain-containing protein [Alphaproteobacteria bacterium]
MAELGRAVDRFYHSRWFRRLGYAVIAGWLVFGLVWFGGPPALRAALVWALERDGTAQAEIGEVAVDLYPLELTLTDVEIVPTAGGEGVSARRLHAGLGFKALFDRRVLLRGVEVAGLSLPLRRGETGDWSVGGFAFPEPAAEDAQNGPEESGWQVGVSRFALTDTRLQVTDGSIDQTLHIERLHLTRLFSWAPASEATMSLAAALSGAQLTAEASAHPFAETRDGRVSLKLDELPLSGFAPLLVPHGVNSLGGSASIDMSFGVTPDGKGGLKADADGALSFDGLSMTTADGPVAAGSLRWTGKITATRGADGDLGEAGLSGTLAAADVSLVTADGRIRARSLRWNGTATVSEGGQDTAVKADIKGTLRAEGLSVPGADGPVGAASLRWDGAITATQHSQGGLIEGAADGAIGAGGVTAGIAGGDVALEQVGWKGKAGLRHDPGRTDQGQLEGMLDLSGLRVRSGDTGGSAGKFVWDGTLGFSQDVAANGMTGKLRGNAALSGLSLRTGADGVAVAIGRVEWDGQGDAQKPGGAAEFLGSVDGALSLADVAVDSADGATRFGAADRMRTSALSLSLQNAVSLRDVVMEGVRAMQSLENGAPAGQPFASLRQASAPEARYAPADGVTVGAVRLDGAAVTLVHAGGGNFPIPPQRRAEAQDSGAGNSEAKEDGAAGGKEGGMPAISVAGLQLGGESQVAFIDRSTEPPWTATVTPVTATIGKVDSAAPQTAVPVTLSLGLPAGGTAKLDGSVRLFSDAMTGRIKVSVDRLELPEVSPMARRHLGLTLQTGRLGGTLDIEAQEGALSGSGKLDIQRLAVEIADREKAQPLVGQLPLPLNSALNLLRGREGEIALDIPISGDVTDPQFDLSNIINKAIGTALARTAMTTVKVLFPLGGLASMVLSESGKVRFAPMPFEAGSAVPGAEGGKYIEQLAGLLEKRPGVTVALCGKAGPADRDALLAAKERRAAEERRATRLAPREDRPAGQASAESAVTRTEMEALAGARAAAARTALVERAGVDAGRLLQCAPAAEDDSDAAPRVEVTL